MWTLGSTAYELAPSCNAEEVHEIAEAAQRPARRNGGWGR